MLIYFYFFNEIYLKDMDLCVCQRTGSEGEKQIETEIENESIAFCFILLI